jgi:putative membrane protein
MPSPAEQDPRIYFAAERTLLAWIRTGIALMAFGFAIARFGLFLRQIQATQTAATPSHSTWGSPLAGVTLIAIGVLVNIGATINYRRIIHQLSSGTWVPGKVSRTAITLSTLLAVLGVLMAIYLILLR